jgi:hypothetical protein
MVEITGVSGLHFTDEAPVIQALVAREFVSVVRPDVMAVMFQPVAEASRPTHSCH